MSLACVPSGLPPFVYRHNACRRMSAIACKKLFYRIFNNWVIGQLGNLSEIEALKGILCQYQRFQIKTSLGLRFFERFHSDSQSISVANATRALKALVVKRPTPYVDG
jgi:hypothetical protein